jgi:hypothetical protein
MYIGDMHLWTVTSTVWLTLYEIRARACEWFVLRRRRRKDIGGRPRQADGPDPLLARGQFVSVQLAEWHNGTTVGSSNNTSWVGCRSKEELWIGILQIADRRAIFGAC